MKGFAPPNAPPGILAAGLLALVACLLSHPAAQAQVPGRCEIPPPEGTSQVGCYLLESVELGRLPGRQVYWHLYAFPTPAAAEESAGTRGTAVEAFGRTWLFAVAGEEWRPSGGTRVSVLGPLAVEADRPYSARYLKSTLVPGLQTRVHRHEGPELWYVVEGAQCLETRAGRTVVTPGDTATAPAGTAMQLSNFGPDTSRALLLILHESDRPWVDRGPVDWKPADLCGR
jgi:quercetin dioxygenase-like cupin family protein